MSKSHLTSTFSFALAASAFALSAAAADAPKGSTGKAVAANDKVHCYAIHECKGNSDCKTTEHSCKGQNACKGHGFKAVTAQECLASSGIIGDMK